MFTQLLTAALLAGVLDRLRFLPIKKMDQRTCIKFCVKNEIKCADAFRMLTVAYGEATLDRSNVYRWYKMFSEGREDVNDEERAGRPSTSTTDEKINEVEKMILANRRITVREVAEGLNISIGSCHSIFINDLGMRRVAAKFVPKLLNCDQKQHRMNIANEMLDSVRDNPNLLQRVITGDEAWVYGYEVETKAQSSQWKLPHEPRPKKAHQVRSNVKVLLTVFFDCRGVVHDEFLPQKPMKGRRYATLDEIKTASKEELKKIFKNDFLKCFEDWKNSWHKCIITHGDYFEGDKIAFRDLRCLPRNANVLEKSYQKIRKSAEILRQQQRIFTHRRVGEMPENLRTTLLDLEQDTGISKTTIGRIVTEDLKLKKTPAKFISRFLTNVQNLCRLATCEDMLERTRTDPEWKDKIITGDETWVYGYDPETKRQSAEWRGQGTEPPLTKENIREIIRKGRDLRVRRRQLWEDLCHSPVAKQYKPEEHLVLPWFVAADCRPTFSAPPAAIRRVLGAVAQDRPFLLHCPSLYPITALLLKIFPEPRAYSCLVGLLDDPGRKHFTATTQKAALKQSFALQALLQRFDRHAASHFPGQLHHVFLSWPGWLFTVFRQLTALRIADCFLLDGDKALYRFALAAMIIYDKYTHLMRETEKENPIGSFFDFCKDFPFQTQYLVDTAYGFRGLSRKQIIKLENKEWPDVVVPLNRGPDIADELLGMPPTRPPHGSALVSREMLAWFWRELPLRELVCKKLQLVFSTAIHGSSMQTLLRCAGNEAYTIILIRPENGPIIGAYCADPWLAANSTPNQSTFVFSNDKAYHWNGGPGPFMARRADCLMIGQGPALTIEESLYYGWTEASPTFDNPSLLDENRFYILRLEILALVDM
ncbi:hypothetical protein LAZ67_17000510 [Cordylochernes scorpioides]|uniref:TLDc domain-containing protein n=1 Tax=Cordylochernes scorpioides TaxID=51811 RepID=A0ABY6LE28_9ARAC|nr:hypothetical protein LAZ67_17000510 [Cordylochernes scorpioides]